MYIFCFTISFFFTQCYLFLLLKCIHFLAFVYFSGQTTNLSVNQNFHDLPAELCMGCRLTYFYYFLLFLWVFYHFLPIFDKLIDRYIQKEHLVVKYFQMIYYKFVKKKNLPDLCPADIDQVICMFCTGLMSALTVKMRFIDSYSAHLHHHMTGSDRLLFSVFNPGVSFYAFSSNKKLALL